MFRYINDKMIEIDDMRNTLLGLKDERRCYVGRATLNRYNDAIRDLTKKLGVASAELVEMMAAYTEEKIKDGMKK